MRVFKTMPIIAIAAEAEHTITTPGDSNLYCIVRCEVYGMSPSDYRKVAKK